MAEIQIVMIAESQNKKPNPRKRQCTSNSYSFRSAQATTSVDYSIESGLVLSNNIHLKLNTYCQQEECIML